MESKNSKNPHVSVSGIYAGIMIGLAGWVNLSVGGPIGALLFSFGLLGVCSMGLKLYTGMAGSFTFNMKSMDILWALVGNILGVGLVAIMSCDSIELQASVIVDDRMSTEPLTALFKAIGCGILMEMAVWYYHKKKRSPLAIFFCVPAFILGGMHHCVADAYYYMSSILARMEPNALLIFPITVIGNFIGCNLCGLFHGKEWK